MFQPILPIVAATVGNIRCFQAQRIVLPPSSSHHFPYPQSAQRSARPIYQVLVTDDDSRLRALERLILERNGGLKVIDTGDSDEAIAICQTQPISLVICDILKPRMNGLVILKTLRSNPATQHVPFMFVTASGMDRRVSPLELGANDYLPKPFLPQEFLSRVWRLLTWRN
jgi:CheY-like chemotaxis protein